MPALQTVREATVGKLRLRLVRQGGTFIGVVCAADGAQKVRIEGDVADDIWRQLHAEVGKADPQYFGFSGARARFLHFFPGGFQSPDYLDRERHYKINAKIKLESTAPLNEAVVGSGFGAAVLSAFQTTNLLSPYELIRVRDMLKSSDADIFIRSAAQFSLGEINTALIAMDRVMRPYDSAKWTVVTYLPISVEAGSAYVSKAYGNEGLCGAHRASLRLRLSVKPGH
jgi:hypothetical protein